MGIMSELQLNALYKRLYEKVGRDKSKIMMLTCLVLIASEAPLYFFTLLDVIKLPQLFKYRLHYDPDFAGHLGVRKYPPLKITLAAFKDSSFNFLFAYLIPTTILIKLSCKLGIFPYDTEENKEKVTWTRLLKETFMISVVADLLFYGLHRLVHTKHLYKPLHKKHHDFKYTIAMTHHYMEYTEALLFSLPQALPPLIILLLTGRKTHITSMWAGMLYSQTAATLGHAGWRIPFIPDSLPAFQASFHDYHHVDYSSNFAAVYPWTDKLFGTYISPELNKNLPLSAAEGKSWFDRVTLSG